MNKHLIVIGIVVILLAVALSGCEELSQDGGTQGNTDFEIISYSVESWEDKVLGLDDIKIGDGFLHSDEVDLFTIKGIVKNNAGRLIEALEIKAKFYDGNGIFLLDWTETLYNIPDTYEEEFVFSMHSHYTTYFDNIESVSISAND